MKAYRTEYPRPQLKRDSFICLNGEWDFEIDSEMTGRDRALEKATSLPLKINVPFAPESKLSGIGNTDFMNCVWYTRTFKQKQGNFRTILHFGACDYETEVWINGVSAGTHRGGYVSFSFDITELVRKGENRITVCAKDIQSDHSAPSGKQSEALIPSGCMYTRTTGIWQTVWLENVPKSYIKHLKMTPDINSSTLLIEAETVDGNGLTLSAEAFAGDKASGSASVVMRGNKALLMLKIKRQHLWSPADPFLYGLTLTLGEDKVESYFGMREISFSEGIISINGKPTFQRLVLDQGFYPDGIYTAKDEEELERDIILAKEMGFNGARLHQKVYEERFLYYCDKHGYIVWGEFPSWGVDSHLPETWKSFIPQWLEELTRDYNHPSIIGWCPQNETRW